MVQVAGVQIVNTGKHFSDIGFISRKDEQGALGLDGSELGESVDEMVMGPVAVNVVVNQIQNQCRCSLIVKETALEFTSLRK